MTQLPAVLPDAPPSNVCGNTTSITLFTTLAPVGRFVMPALFAATRAIPKTLEAMDRLSFISYASWSVVRDIPYNGLPQATRRLRHAHLFFEVHFNGSWAQYIDSSVRFFKVHEVDTDHYFCAYPEATVTIVRSALALERRLDMFAHRAALLQPEAFDEAWDAFLEDAQVFL